MYLQIATTQQCLVITTFLTCGKICKANINKCKRHNEAYPCTLLVFENAKLFLRYKMAR